MGLLTYAIIGILTPTGAMTRSLAISEGRLVTMYRGLADTVERFLILEGILTLQNIGLTTE